MASAFSGAVTVPFLMVSTLFISSFLGSRDVTFSPAAIMTLAFLMVIASVSTFGFLKEFSKRFNPMLGPGSSPVIPFAIPPGNPDKGPTLSLSSAKEREWEESPKNREGEA